MSEKSRKNKKRAKKTKMKIYRIVGIALLLVLVIGVAWLGKQKLDEKQRNDANAALQSLYHNPVKAQKDAGTESSGNGDDTKQSSALLPVTALTAASAPVAGDELIFQSDFDELYAVNPDVVGWIDVGNYMSMPVVYRDNTFYLNHDYYGNPDNAGTLFINEANTIWPKDGQPADQNLLFHGHNMRDGSIFGDLDEYRKLDYMQENVIVYFRTIYDYDPIPYVIFSAFDMSATPGESGYFDVGYINFDNDAEFEEYTGTVLRRSFFNMPYGVQRNDRMLSLFTCSYSNENGRFVLFCRELHEGETVESVLDAAKLITKK